MKFIKYLIFLSVSLVAITNTIQCMKAQNIKDLGRPVFFKKFERSINKIYQSPDCKIIILQLDKKVIEKFYKTIILNWKNNKKKSVYLLEIIRRIGFEKFPTLSLFVPGSIIDTADMVCIKELYPQVKNFKAYKKQLKIDKGVTPHSIGTKSFLIPDVDPLSIRSCSKKYENFKILFNTQQEDKQNIWYALVTYTDGSERKFKSCGPCHLAQDGTYIGFKAAGDNSLNIFNTKNKKLILNLHKNQCDKYRFVGPDHLCISKDNKLRVFNLEVVQKQTHKNKTQKRLAKNRQRRFRTDVFIELESY